MKAIKVYLALMFLFGASGCSDRPRGRIGCYPSSTFGTRFLGPKDLGRHGYKFNFSEQNGAVYTCAAGHIDTAHARKTIDWTKYSSNKIFECLKKGRRKFSINLHEPTVYSMEFSYPQGWDNLTEEEKEKTARDISIKLAQYLSFYAATWHEILSWFGYKSTLIIPEFPSAFSWEDNFSNLLGVYIGGLALKDKEHNFDEAVTIILKRELEKLGAQPGFVARKASESVKNRWFSGDLCFVKMKKRNFDIGLDDGFITPCLVPFLRQCQGIEAKPYPVPNLDFLPEYGFSVKFEIELKSWEKKKILNIIYPDEEKKKNRIEPNVHFAPIMDYIKEQALKKYGPDPDVDSR